MILEIITLSEEPVKEYVLLEYLRNMIPFIKQKPVRRQNNEIVAVDTETG